MTASGQGPGLFTTALSAAEDSVFGEQDATGDTAPETVMSGLGDVVDPAALAAEFGNDPGRGADRQALDMATQVPSTIDPALLLAQSGFPGPQIQPGGSSTMARTPLPAPGSTGAASIAAVRSTVGTVQRGHERYADACAAGVAAPVDRSIRPAVAVSMQPARMVEPADERSFVEEGTVDSTRAGTARPGAMPAHVVNSVGKSMPAALARFDADELPPLRTQGLAGASTPETMDDPAVVLRPAPFLVAEAGPQAHTGERTVATTALMPFLGHVESAKEPALVTAALEFTGLQRLDRQKTVAASGATPSVDAGGAASVAALPVAAASTPSGPDPAGAYRAPAEHLVNQVSWWLSQNAQGADFQIAMPGGQPVSVSVQIRGHEAQVAFHSDQPEIRQVLTQALPQLKDAFGHEGLLLSGASVGGNADGRGADRSDARQSPRAPAARDAGWRESGAAIAAVRPVPAGASGRSLDLYV